MVLNARNTNRRFLGKVPRCNRRRVKDNRKAKKNRVWSYRSTSQRQDTGKYVIIEIKINPDYTAIAQIAKYIVSLEKEGVQRDKLRAVLVSKEIDQQTRELCKFFNIETFLTGQGLKYQKNWLKRYQKELDF